MCPVESIEKDFAIGNPSTSTALQAVTEQNPQLELVEKKGGFVLLKRNDNKIINDTK